MLALLNHKAGKSPLYWPHVGHTHRHRSLARQLAERCLAEAHRRNLQVVSLHASDEGRSLDESLGFCPTNEMLLAAAYGTAPNS